MDTMPVGTILAANPAVAEAKKIKTIKNFIIRKSFFLFPSIVNLPSAPEKQSKYSSASMATELCSKCSLCENDELLPLDTVAL
jgi:hypothetical protein